MGFTAAIAVAALAAGSAAGKSSSKMPTFNIEQPPAPVDATPKPMADASTAARKKVSGAQGIQDTILTGAQGLGQINPANAPVKTLLGY
jgi:hypothetical protein